MRRCTPSGLSQVVTTSSRFSTLKLGTLINLDLVRSAVERGRDVTSAGYEDVAKALNTSDCKKLAKGFLLG